MSKKSIKKSLNAGAYLIEKNINVFSDQDLKKQYSSLLKNIFGISLFAVKVYDYAQKAEKLDEYVILKKDEIALALKLKTAEKIPKAIDELVSADLIAPGPTAELYCLAADKPFNEERNNEILLTISIKKITALQEDLEPEPIRGIKPAKRNDVLKDYLQQQYEYTEKELLELDEVFQHKDLTKEKFFERIKEWEKSMRDNITTVQKKNYLTACLVYEEWK